MGRANNLRAKARKKRDKIIARDGVHCRWCGVETELGAADLSYQMTVDHIVSIMAGGTSAIENLCIACHDCNQRRARDEEMLMRQRNGHLREALSRALQG